jgi:multidrug resistance efflux pump
VAQAEAVRAEVIRGGRDDRRAEAEAALRAAEATLAQADSARARVRSLQAEGFSALAELEVAERDLRVAAGLRDAARERVSVETAAPTAEALLRIDADIEVHRAVSHEIAAQLELCTTVAPSDGVVLQIHVRPGERWTALLGVPVLVLADMTAARVRAEVDERDATRVQVGQHVSIQSDAWPGEALRGRVTALTPQMGRRAVLTGAPAERRDQDVREVLVALEIADQRALPGLRVTVIITPGGPAR